MPYMHIFWLEFGKGTVIFEVTLKSFWKEDFVQKWKSLNLGPKMPYLGILGSDFVTTLSHLKSTPLDFSHCEV